MLTSGPRAIHGLFLLLFATAGVAPPALAVSAEVATTTSVVLTAPRPDSVSVAITVTAADGTASVR